VFEIESLIEHGADK